VHCRTRFAGCVTGFAAMVQPRILSRSAPSVSRRKALVGRYAALQSARYTACSRLGTQQCNRLGTLQCNRLGTQQCNRLGTQQCSRLGTERCRDSVRIASRSPPWLHVKSTRRCTSTCLASGTFRTHATQRADPDPVPRSGMRVRLTARVNVQPAGHDE
jgi:hypothetical protein